MRSKLLLFTVVSLLGLVAARYIGDPWDTNGHKNLLRRQMESTGGSTNNPFGGPSNPFTQAPVRFQIEADNEEVDEDELEDGQGTPRFTSTGVDEDIDEADQSDSDNIPTFSGTGLATALDRLDLSQLQRSPNYNAPANSELQIHPSGVASDVSEGIQVSQDIINNKPENNGEPEYADFIVDPSEPASKHGAARGLERNTDSGLPLRAQTASALVPQRIRRPWDQPKRDHLGRRMGWILNEWEWLPNGETQPVHPYWGVIQPGHEVGEEPDYLDDDTPPVSEADQGEDFNDKLKSLYSDKIEGLRRSDDSEGSFYSDEEGRERFYTANAPSLADEIAIFNSRNAAETQEIPADLQRVDEVDEYVAESQVGGNSVLSDEPDIGSSSEGFVEDILKTTDEISLNEIPEEPESSPNIATVTKVDPDYISKQVASLNELYKPHRLRAEVDIEPEAPEVGVPRDLLNMYGGYVGSEKSQDKSGLSRVTGFLKSLPIQAGRTVVNTVNRVRGKSRNRPATIQTNIDPSVLPDVSPMKTDTYNAPLIDFGDPGEDDKTSKGRKRLPV
ncbi:hypothetical protein TWF694_003281 [Orbilia ellipsospora]|uniref:Uncharacterized protein n=1 Tax=Orbilia ellipsospora TaxID=2528407 RepID=A0AAV9X212_9PEZI